ncbi:MAG: putative lipid II flippase FtsW [Clostridiales bacterium]|nr:putative lipid II flippase FtsW [Clostridiales bacterium]
MLGTSSAQKTRAPLLSRYKRQPVDKMLLTVMLLLLSSGLLVLFSATYYTAQDAGDPLREVRSQLLGIALGAVACFVTSRIPYRFWKDTWVVVGLLILSAVLLTLVIIPGVGVYINGSRRWLSLGGLSFQPSELAKFSVVMFLATTLCYRGRNIRSLFRGIVPVLLVPGIVFLLILQQPNLSTAGSILIVSLVMIIIAGAKWRHILLMTAGGLSLGAFYAWAEPYRRRRMMSFRDPFAMMSDEGYQLSQSLIAFGSGGLFGMGLGMGRQKYAYLPYPESDFIFAIVGEDFGLAGCLVVIALFVAFLLAGMRIAVSCRDKFGMLLSAGITASITVQAFLNMGVVIGILPTTGLPLPFFSAGGTSISITMAAVGIVLNVSRTGGVVDA